jgi:uncharacterized protein
VRSSSTSHGDNAPFFFWGKTMATGSLLTLLDDIATILDDVAVMTKVAAKKTAGVLGDDLALNAQQVAGVNADRELPVVWAVTKGSLVNKAILVPLALLISAFAPWAVTPLLMAGGLFLCFEGFEKIAHAFLHAPKDQAAAHAAWVKAAADPTVDLVAFEQEKIKGAVRTDFILSAEIIAITLGVVASEPLMQRLAVLVGMALLMTGGVYGLVAAIVKLDDAGLFLSQRAGESAFAALQRRLGVCVLRAAPLLMKSLSVAGTAAMFLVGGGILSHGLAALHQALEAGTAALPSGLWRTVVSWVGPPLMDAAVGLLSGAVAVAVWHAAKRLLGRARRSS